MASEYITPFSAFSPLDLTNSGGAPSPRRSLSIFSRRGGTPKPQIDRLPSIVSKRNSIRIPMPERRTSNMFNKNRRADSKGPSSGTILRAVPESVSNGSGHAGHSMSSLELAMVTSPNEEILSAIGLPSPTPTVNSPYAYPPNNGTQHSLSMKRPRRTSDTRSIKTNIIGMWTNGETRWSSDKSTSITSKESLGAMTVPSTPTFETPKAKHQRPRIQIVIPSGRLPQAFQSMPLFHSTVSSPSVHADASAGPVTNEDVSVPLGAIGKTTTILMSTSALEPHQPQPQRSFPRLPAHLNDQPPVASHSTRPSFSNSTSSDGSSNTEEDDNDSKYSDKSSMTSLESAQAANGQFLQPNGLHKRTGSQAFSIMSPAAAGVYDESRKGDSPSDSSSPTELPGSPVPARRPSRSRSAAAAVARTRSRKRMSSRRGVRLLTTPREPLPTTSDGKRRPSPTLSYAERELESTLSTIDAAMSPNQECSEKESSSLPELPPVVEKPPTPPPKSSRRTSLHSRSPPSRIQSAPRRMSVQVRSPRSKAAPVQAEKLVLADQEVTEQARTRQSKQTLKHHGLRSINSTTMPDIAEMLRSETPELTRKQRELAERQISARQAEEVILHIMQSVQCLDDLFNTVVLNKGFYRVFKRYELELLKTVLKNDSEPAWEFMETSKPCAEGTDDEGNPISAIPIDYTAATFLRTYVESHATLISLKALILAKCQSFLRTTTVIALASDDPTVSVRVDGALWRIWSFCRIFGSSRGREDDLVGQMDWLRGGQLAHQQTCTSTIVSSDSFYMSSVLLNAPEYFARGNGKTGLSAEDLYDMTELWNCFNWLVQGLEGRTEQARQYGVFDNTEVRGGDIDGEEAMLEEFQSHILTLGLEPLLVIASALLPEDDNTPIGESTADPTALGIAYERGWSKWTPPPSGGSRSTFLKEPLARLYEERIAAAFAATEEQERQAKSEEMKEVRRLRGQSYAEEIKLRKRSMGSDRSSGESSSSRPRSGWSDERPMSEWEIVINQLASPTTGTPPAIDENKVFEMMSPEEFEKDLAISEGGRSTPATGTSITLSSVPHLAYGKYSPSGPSSTGSYSPALRPLPPSPLSPHFPTESISPPSSSAASLYNEVHPALRNDIHPALRSAPHSRNVSAESDSSFYSVSSRSRASMQHPMQAQMSNNAEADLAANSSERAIFRIVEMGWTADEARHALMVTDLGDGLRIDRAVELLLRQ